jgi:hypothetical protein
MPPSNKLILALAVSAALAACGGGGGSSATDPTPPVTVTPPVVTPTAAKGVMIDGYVRGATVFCDSNGNGALDTGELSATTDNGGNFSITGGCSAGIVGFGGTNADTGFPFTGQLKAPAGSTVITPLTNLLVGTGLTNAQLAELLGQPSGTDLTKIDIANGQNDDLYKKTLAVQQVIDSIARVTLDKNAGSDAKTVYTRVASDFAKSLVTQTTGTTGTQLIGSGGDLNSTLLSTVVKSLPDVVALNLSTADADATINTLAADAQQLSRATTTELATIVKSLQDPVRPTVTTSAVTNYLALSNDSIAFNATPYGLRALAAGPTLAGLETIGITLDVNGTPLPDVTSAIVLELVERGGDGRKLQLMIDQVKIKLDAQQQLSVTVPSNSRVYAYGYTRNGTEVNLTITDLAFTPIRVANNGFTLNYTNMVNKVMASADLNGRSTAERFLAIKGNFDFRVIVAKVNIRRTDGTAYASETVRITNTSQTVTGAAVTGNLTIQ